MQKANNGLYTVFMNSIIYSDSFNRVNPEWVKKTLEDFPVFLRSELLKLEDPLLQEYLLLPIDEILKRLSKFRNKLPCGILHDRNLILTSDVCPDWIWEVDFIWAFDDILKGKENPIFHQVNVLFLRGLDNCTYKINNLNCWHPEDTGLIQLLILFISYLRQKNISFEYAECIDLINQLKDVDNNLPKHIGLMGVDGVKNLQFEIWEKIRKIIESVWVHLDMISV